MKILVCGGRHFNNYTVMSFVVTDYIKNNCSIDDSIEIVSGGCSGADSLAEMYAKENNFKMTIFKPDWKMFGRAAGPIRNKNMIDYIKDDKSCVIAFTSKDTKGTRNTIQLANKVKIPVIEIPYEVFEETTELYEGVRKSIGGTFELDWDNNMPEDLVKLEGSCVHITKYNKNIRCYGYKVNKVQANKKDRNEFLSFLKMQPSNERTELISRCIEDFYEKCPQKHFDYVLKIPSKSSLNDEIIEQLNKYDSFKIVSLLKRPINDLELNLDLIKSKFHGDYIENFIDYLQKIIDYNKKKDNFSISTFKPQYRAFIKPMISFGDEDIDNTPYTNILIVDDIFTSGSTMDMVLNLLNDLNFQGTITMLTLIQNN